MPGRRVPTAPILIYSGAVACVVGFVSNRLWMQLPWPRIADALALVLVWVSVSALLRRWRGWAWADAIAATWFVALIVFVGVWPVGAALLLATAACALGGMLLPREGVRIVLALPIGLALIGGVAGWTLLLPVHHRFVYAPLLLLACFARRRALYGMAAHACSGWRAAVDAAPGFSAFALLALGLASIGTWLPTMQADDLAYHLALPSQLLRDASYRPDATEQIWALAPWLGDTLQGIVQVLAAQEARGALNALWLLSAAAGIWAVARRIGADTKTAWLAVASYASLPLLAALASGMHTELPAATLLVALTLIILGRGNGRMACACAVLAAGLFGLKLGHATAALALLAWALLRHRGPVAWRSLLAALPLFAVLAGSSYAFAYAISGNPLLPMFNDVFQSPLMPSRQLTDPRWHAGFGLDLPWAITFDTDRYLEAWDGGFGFVLIALAGAWLLALARPQTRGLAAVASAALLLPLLPMQYARYAFPGLVLLLPVLLVALRWALGERRAASFALALCVLDLVFQANSNGLLHASAVRRLATGKGLPVLYEQYAPERALIAELQRQDASGSIVLALDPAASYVAELGRRGRTVAWYAPTRERERIEAEADASGAAWQRLIDDAQARWLLLRPARTSAALHSGLQRVGARPVATIGEAQLWSVGASKG